LRANINSSNITISFLEGSSEQVKLEEAAVNRQPHSNDIQDNNSNNTTSSFLQGGSELRQL
jgi:hypothetical protein